MEFAEVFVVLVVVHFTGEDVHRNLTRKLNHNQHHKLNQTQPQTNPQTPPNSTELHQTPPKIMTLIVDSAHLININFKSILILIILNFVVL